MWKKYGEKLEKTNLSPTEQEYQWVLNRQDNTFIQFYFKESDIKCPTNDECSEIIKVNDFQNKIKESNNGVYRTFKIEDEFKEEIKKTLRYYIENRTTLTYKKSKLKKNTSGVT